jgi:hypothetical protein
METATMTPQVESKIIFIDEGNWHIGQPCLNAVARFSDGSPDLPVGQIMFLYDNVAKQAVYAGQHLDGIERFEPTHRLAVLKQRFQINKDELIQYARAGKEERTLDPLQSKGKNTEPVLSPYAPEPQKTKAKVRERSTKRVRNMKGKSKGNSRTR